MARYGVTYEIRLFANYSIEAESESDALEMAEHLTFCDDFMSEKLLPDLLDDEQVGDALNWLRVYANPDDPEGSDTEHLDVDKYTKE